MNNCLKSAYTLLEIFNEDSVIENNEYYQLVNDMRTPLLLEANQDVLYSFISLMGNFIFKRLFYKTRTARVIGRFCVIISMVVRVELLYE